MRVFTTTGPFVRMITVIAIDLKVFVLIVIVFLLASSFFFLINDADSQAFAVDQSRIGLMLRACSHNQQIDTCVDSN